MTIQQQPGAYCLTSMVPDFIISDVDTLQFSIKHAGDVILEEYYVSDNSGKIRISDLGKIMERYLYGEMKTGRLGSVIGIFEFYLNQVLSCTTKAILCRAQSDRSASEFSSLVNPMHLQFGNKISLPNCREYISFYMNSQDNLFGKIIYLESGQLKESELTNIASVSDAGVYCFEVSLSMMSATFLGVNPTDIVAYQVGVGGVMTQFSIDWNQYIDTKVFRYLNSFGCPSLFVSSGEITRKRSISFESSKILGLEKRYSVKRSDSFKVQIGRKYSRTDELLIAEMVTSEIVQVYFRGAFRDIIITEDDSEEIQRRGNFSSSSFSFRFANEKTNLMLQDQIWILNNGTWNDWGNWIDLEPWND